MSPRQCGPFQGSPAAGQPRYARPDLPATTYYSPAGEPIPYGRQWGAEGPDPAPTAWTATPSVSPDSTSWRVP